MAKDLYNGPLNKDMDFTNPVGDGRPASGYAVQNYIKEIDSNKYGAAFVDNENNCLFFATEDDMETYKADPSRTDLIKNSIEMGGEPKYRIVIDITEPENNYAAVFYGSKGNYIRYTFQTLDRDGARFPEAVDAVYTIQNGETSTIIRENYSVGANVSFNVDNYLLEGNNEIAITLTGKISHVQKTIGVSFQAVNISLIEDMDISTIYTTSDSMIVNGTVTGGGTRYFEWYIDGKQLKQTAADTIVSVGDAEYTRRIDFYNIELADPNDTLVLSAGRHNLQYRAYVAVIGGDRFYTNTMYRDFVINDQTLSGVTILTKFESPKRYGIIDAFTQPIALYGPIQYEVFHMGYAIYSKTNAPSESLSITIGTREAAFSIHNNVTYDYEIREFEDGITPIVFSCRDTSLAYNATIEKSDYDLEPITDTQFEFSGNDRSNDSDEYTKSHWSFSDYMGTLTGFNWTESSGWVDGNLIVPGGARFDTNYKPFEVDAKNHGFTFEIEFSTTHVLDETVPIIDLRNNGQGLLITASEIKFSSRGGITVNTKYKPDENVRAAVVVTPITSQTYPGFIFIYIDGILTGAITYASNDSFVSTTDLSVIGSNNAIVSIKQIRTYTRALTANEILDNYILYRDTVADLVAAYDRNDIYTAGQYISKDKLSAYTPIIVITGNVNKLQNFTKEDKKTYVKMDKIEVINMADPTKNMILINPSMRCQGTSSMEYPRKNFRFYTQADSKDTTVDPYVTQMFDWQGNELIGEHRLYSFKENAQPVSCWCLKADYAESSSTHNTGVARMWNNYMKVAHLDDNDIDPRHYIKTIFPNSNTPCKTIAQHLADSNHFEYDVRTTVDGFPITLFFHEREEDPLTFLGRYNWNNDKSTESVYGFCDIPGFEPYEDTMECWEVVNGDKVCNLFTDLTNWNNGKGMTGGWYDSFESRYPDDHDKATETARATGPGSALKRVATWINSTMGASKVQDGEMVVDDPALMNIFSTQKWDYLDVYKVAAYYVYLMRFGAVDQTVKNAMFTTEDGLHWYYINYDNDTINGVENSGALTLGYDINRQSPVPGTAGSYCYAGHDSVLWNNLEADVEFMAIVKKVDNALYKAGLTYAGVIDMFNNQQSAMWAERTHNEDYAYKYLNIDDRTQLSKLQGPRKSHRQWWLSHRFAIYDAIYGTESYLNNRIAIKPVTSTDARTGQYVTVTPAVDGQIFGYGYQNPVVTGIHGTKGVPIQFDMVESYYEGTTIKFFNAVYFDEIDISKISKYVKEFDFTQVNTTAFDSQLTNLILGKIDSEVNTNMTKIENLGQFKYLENLEMCNYQGFNKINLTENKYLKTLDFRNCTSLSSVELPIAAPITTIQYPYSINSIELNELLNLNTVNIQTDSNGKQFVYDINISNCPNITNSVSFLLNWMDTRDSSILDTDCNVFMDNVAWNNISMSDLLKIATLAQNAGFGDGQNINFKGYAELDGRIESPEQAEFLMNAFGDSVFDKSSAFYIDAPAQVYLVGETELLEGESATYRGIVIGDDGTGVGIYQIYSPGSGNESIDQTTGVLTTIEPLTPEDTHNITIRYAYIKGGVPNYGYLTVQITQRVYPSSDQVTLTGPNEIKIGIPNEYNIGYVEGINGNMSTEWTVTGDIASKVSITSHDTTHCTVSLNGNPEVDSISGTITATIKKTAWPSVIIATKSVNIGYQDDTIAVSRAINPLVMDVLVQNNLINPSLGDTNDKMTKASASLITSNQFQPGTSQNTSIFAGNSQFKNNCTNFDELQWFTGVTTLGPYLFYGCSKLTHVILSASVENIGNQAFRNTKISEINLTEGFREIGESAFSGTLLTSITLPSSIESIGNYAFNNIASLTNIVFPETFEHNLSIGPSAFYNTGLSGSLILSEGVTSIQSSAFGDCSGLTSVTIPSSVTTLSAYGFINCTNLTTVNINCNIPDYCFRINYSSYSVFYGCSSLTTVNIGSGCKTIGNSAFKDQTWLIGCMDIPDTVMNINTYAFQNCIGITSVIFRGSYTFGTRAFEGCTGITTIDFYGDVPNYCCYGYNGGSIYNGIFMNCPSLSSVSIHEGCTTIGNYAFYQCTFITGALLLPSTIITIGEQAFSYCTGITSVTIGESIVSLNKASFGWCTGITTVTFNGNVPSNSLSTSYSNYNYPPFYGSNNITTVNIGENCTHIGNYAFNGRQNVEFNISNNAQIEFFDYMCFNACKKLTSIDLTNTSEIGLSAFGDTGLISVYLPATVTLAPGHQYKYVFNNCHDLKTVYTEQVYDEMFYVNSSNAVFYGSENIETIVVLGEPQSIPSAFCQNCSKLSSITIPSTVTSIGGNAFSGCTSLESINIPEGVTTIGNSAFYNCSSLESIDILASVASIASNSFTNCINVESITVDSENTTYTDGGGKNCIVEISNNRLIIGCKNTQLYEGIVSINSGVFSNIVDLKSINIPASLTNIYGGGSTFKNCELETITVASGNTVYTDGGALGCKNCIVQRSNNTLIVGSKNTEIYSGITTIGDSAFYGRTNLTSITIPSTVTEISSYAFKGCTGLSSVTFPNDWSNYPRLYQQIFYGCTGLTSITLPDYWHFGGTNTFEGCSNLVIVNIVGNNHRDDIGNEYFKNCSSLTAFTIPSGITTIYSQPFENCKSLTSMNIPASVSSIYSDENPFYGCELTYITVDSQNTNYSDRGGKNCIVNTANNKLISGCKNTVIPTDTSIEISSQAFSYNDSITSITIPSNVTNIQTGSPTRAFGHCSNLETVNISCNVSDNSFQWDNNGYCNVSGPFAYSPVTNVTIGEGCQTIGKNAFSNRTFETSIDLPSTITSIGNYAFRSNTNLATIICRAITPPTLGNSETFPGTAVVQHVYVPSASVSAYQSASGWNTYATIIEAIPTP